MRNLLLIARREYIERVRSKAFLFSTIAIPALMLALSVLPQKLASMDRGGGVRRIAVASADFQLAEAFKRHLIGNSTRNGTQYRVELAGASDAERKLLADRIGRNELDAYVWLPQDALVERRVTYSGRDLSDFLDLAAIRTAVTYAFMERQLAAKGIGSDVTRELIKRVQLDTIRVARGKESRTSTATGFLTSLSLIMLLYVVLMVYGVAVMRSVLEEKRSRVMEVLLSSVNSRDLLSGKILGVGAVGVTQILIWILLMLVAVMPMAASGVLKNVELTPLVMLAFAVFFLLGFLLYSAIYAAIGAMVNSEQEAQQLQLFGVSPLIVAASLMVFVMRQPNSAISVWTSIMPFLSPILMYTRIAAQPPPAWQIALSLVLLLATTWAVMVLAARIYRIGILMYGKRPTLPEIIKWLKYAKA
jgi:ABC-2 type transport system permease protein